MNERRNTKYESLNGMEKERRGRILPKSCSLNCCLTKKLKNQLWEVLLEQATQLFKKYLAPSKEFITA
jgi:hypothetical protein